MNDDELLDWDFRIENPPRKRTRVVTMRFKQTTNGTEMTKNQAQNAIIARYMGYQRIGLIKGTQDLKGDFPPCRGWTSIPDYSADLNAMAQAESKLTEEQLGDYASVLEFVMGIDRKSSRYRKLKLISAPADQRAEAFCKTIHFHSQSPAGPEESLVQSTPAPEA